jgi:spore germination protein GerM
MPKSHPPNGCAAISVLSVAILLFIGIILFLTQKSYLINYFGESSNGEIVRIDSIHQGYYKYEFQYSIRQSTGKFATVTEGSYKNKNHQLGEKVKIKTYKNESDFEAQSPDLYLLISLLFVFALFVRMYFVFR